MIKSLTITAIVIFFLMGINPSVGSEKIQIVPSEYEGKEAGDDCEGRNLDDFVYQGTLAWEDAGYCVKDEECEPAEHLICIGTGVGDHPGFSKPSDTTFYPLPEPSTTALGFTAVCKSDEVHAFRYDSDLHQDTGKGEWNTEEKFPGEWHFYFDGTELIVDGKSTILFPSPAGILIAVDYSASSIAGSLWAYVVLLEQQKIGASQVNASSFLSDAIKMRVTNLDGNFD